MPHLVSDEPRHLRRNELDRLQLVRWIKWVARRSGGLKLLAIGLGPIDVVVRQVCLWLVQLEVELTALSALDVKVVVDVGWAIHFFWDEDCRLSAYRENELVTRNRTESLKMVKAVSAVNLA